MPYEILQSKSISYQDFLFKLIIIGDSAVGKSCLLHRLTTNEFMEDHEVTVGVEFGTLLVKLESQVFKLQIWDTAGQESFKSITKIFYRGAHCIFFSYDITRQESFNSLNHWYEEVLAQSEPDIIMFLIGNKKDLESQREVSIERAEQFRREKGIHFFFETSARTGENVENIFIMAAKMLYHNFKDKITQLREEALQKKKGNQQRLKNKAQNNKQANKGGCC
eukprot:403345307